MTVTYLIPVFANLVGVVFLDEIVTPWMLGCGVVIVLGTALASGLIQRRG
jgi:drug/metabolite transporter (DMT)-like permease